MVTNNYGCVYIVDGVRTPIGKYRGSYAGIPATELGAIAIKGLLERTGVREETIDRVIIGQVYTTGCGQNPARQTLIGAGINNTVVGHTTNMLCGSGLKTVIEGASSIMLMESSVVIAGGQENMTRAPYFTATKEAKEAKEAGGGLKSTLFVDGLIDAFHAYPMGMTAENISDTYSIGRLDQEEYALRSQLKAAHASKNSLFARETIPLTSTNNKLGVVLDHDEYIDNDASLPRFSTLTPCFRTDGTVTTATSSGLNDGSAMVLLMSEPAYRQYKRNLQLTFPHNAFAHNPPLAKIIAWAEVGVDPALMGTGPIPATRLALLKAGWDIDSVDLFEFNEAFAVQSLAVIRELNIDISKCNIHGGAIALGHPLACSGTRILVTLAHALRMYSLKRGVASLCVGGGMGVAICIESCQDT